MLLYWELLVGLDYLHPGGKIYCDFIAVTVLTKSSHEQILAPLAGHDFKANIWVWGITTIIIYSTYPIAFDFCAECLPFLPSTSTVCSKCRVILILFFTIFGAAMTLQMYNTPLTLAQLT